jgi:hypothetical protein
VKQRSLITLGLLPLIAVVGFVGYNTYQREGLGWRKFIKPNSEQLSHLKFDLKRNTNWICSDPQFVNDMHCYLQSVTPTAVVIGDSHSPRLYVGLQEIYKEQGIDLANFGGGGGCPPFINLISKNWPGKDYNLCLERSTKALYYILKDPKINQVILVNRGPAYTLKRGFGAIENGKYDSWVLQLSGESEKSRSNAEAYKISLNNTLNALKQARKEVTYMHPVPELGFDPKDCLKARAIKIHRHHQNMCAVDKSIVLSRNKAHRELVDSVLVQHPEVRVVDPADVLCDQQYCYGMIDGQLMYTDGDHLSKKGSEFVAHKLKNQFFSKR